MTIKQTQTPIGITIPIRDGLSGYFDQSFDTITQIKTNIINLLNTRIGERRMQPTFGSRLWDLVFEQNLESLPDIASNIIREDISLWIPNVTVMDVTSKLLKNNDIDMYKLHIIVSFILNTTKQTEMISITMDNII